MCQILSACGKGIWKYYREPFQCGMITKDACLLAIKEVGLHGNLSFTCHQYYYHWRRNYYAILKQMLWIPYNQYNVIALCFYAVFVTSISVISQRFLGNLPVLTTTNIMTLMLIIPVQLWLPRRIGTLKVFGVTQPRQIPWRWCTLGLTRLHLQEVCSRRLWKYLLKIWKISIIVGIITEKSWKNCGKRRNCSFWTISPFVAMFSKVVCLEMCLKVGTG